MLTDCPQNKKKPPHDDDTDLMEVICSFPNPSTFLCKDSSNLIAYESSIHNLSKRERIFQQIYE